MKTIWKFELDPSNPNIEMPKLAVILTAREQFDKICIWAEVDPVRSTEIRNFEVFGTGHEIYTDMGIERKYIGTAILQGGTYVFHVYERL